MNRRTFFFTIQLLMVASLMSLGTPASAHAQLLPAAVTQQFIPPLEKVGDGTYRKLGFTVYHATLWAPGGKYDKNTPYLLQLRYARNISQKMLSDTVIDNIRKQEVADDETFSHWQEMLQQMLPAINKGDEIVGVSIPGRDSIIYLNGTEFVRIEDRAFSDAFFDIWLGPKADETLQAQLMGR